MFLESRGTTKILLCFAEFSSMQAVFIHVFQKYILIIFSWGIETLLSTEKMIAIDYVRLYKLTYDHMQDDYSENFRKSTLTRILFIGL